MTNNETLQQLHLVDNGQGDTAVCKQCKQPFSVSRVGRPPKFCSSGCRVANWREKRKRDSEKPEGL